MTNPANASELRPLLSGPDFSYEYDEDCETVISTTVGWDLSWGARISIGDACEGEGYSLTLSISDDVQRKGILVRSVKPEQIRDYANKLLALPEVARIAAPEPVEDTDTPSTERGCIAHGNTNCPGCSATKPGGLDNDGDCRGCGQYSATGMHWDTCPHRGDMPRRAAHGGHQATSSSPVRLGALLDEDGAS